VTKKRLGPLAEQTKWIGADITQVELEPLAYTCGMTMQYFIFVPQPINVLLMFETSLGLSSQVGT
jgi:hypothetical protein